MIPTKDHSVVAIYESHTQAEAAIMALHREGLDMKKLSIVAKDFSTEEHVAGFYNTGDRMKFWGTRGAFWGSLWGMLFGTGLFFIPAVGPIVAMGPIAGWIAGALEGAALGATVGVVGAALSGVGIPHDSVVKYEADVKAGKFLVLARGSADEMERARGVLKATGPSQLAAHLA